MTKAAAQSDEIQVYDGGLAQVGVFNLTVHNNFTPNGVKTPAFPGAITSDDSLEWRLGVGIRSDTLLQAGLYLPLYSHDHDLGWKIDGFKLRRCSPCRMPPTPILLRRRLRIQREQ